MRSVSAYRKAEQLNLFQHYYPRAVRDTAKGESRLHFHVIITLSISYIFNAPYKREAGGWNECDLDINLEWSSYISGVGESSLDMYNSSVSFA